MLSAPAWHRLPPPPHDPRERIVVSRAGDWEVRAFSESDPKFEYLVRHGMWHLQLWHSGARVSVLTASALTAGCYEVLPVRGRRARLRSALEAIAMVERHHDVTAPSVGTIVALEAWFVEATVARVLGGDALVALVAEGPGDSASDPPRV